MQTIKIKKGQEAEVISYIKNRTESDLTKIDEQVREILKTVAQEGDKALLAYNKKFDGADQDNLRITEDEIQKAYDSVEDDYKTALIQAAKQIREFHEKQLEKTWTWQKTPDILLGQLVNPVDSAGVYIPGGKAAYPSSVLMNIIPAKIAGVKRIVMVTPPLKDGSVNPYILAAAKIAGADEAFAVGGAQSIAALAYGTESISPVSKIAGPGNIYVARAKKMVYGVVDIDMIAGPSEICILGDETADPAFVAADMLSQAEHDEMAATFFVTTSADVAVKVEKEVYAQLAKLERKEIAGASIRDNAMIVLVEDLDSLFEVSNEIAPEHLEVLLPNPQNYLAKIRHAGAIFLGAYSPEPLGDYMAGPNHTLPTGGTAKFASPLGVYDYQKKSSIIYYQKEALSKEKDAIITIAQKEGLTAHANAVAIRFEK